MPDPNKGHIWELDKNRGWNCRLCSLHVNTLSELFDPCPGPSDYNKEVITTYSIPG